MALPRTPLAPDPGYENSSNFYPKGPSSDPTPRGRVRPEAVDIARVQKMGTVGLLFQPPDITTNSSTRYKRPDPKSHTKENLRRIRQIQAKAKLRREEASKPVKPLYKSSNYDQVPPKVTVHMQHTRPHTAPTSSRLPKQRQSPVFHLEPTTTKPIEVPLLSVSGQRVMSAPGGKRTPKNFLAANIQRAAKAQIKRPPSQEKLDTLQVKKEKELTSYKRGTVPQYLRKRQDEWRKAEEERVAALPDPTIPPGHTMMPNREKTKTLEVLRENYSGLSAELRSLPLRSDTLRVQQRKAQLEAKLAEIEDAIKIFSRQKVFIKLNE